MEEILRNNGYTWNDFIKLFSGEGSLLLSNVSENDLIKIFDYINKNFSDISFNLIQTDRNGSVLLRSRNQSIDDKKCAMLLKQGEKFYNNGQYEQILSCFCKLNSFQSEPNVYTYIMLTLASKRANQHKKASYNQKIADILVRNYSLFLETDYLREKHYLEEKIIKDVNQIFYSDEVSIKILDIFSIERDFILTNQKQNKASIL